MQCKRQDCCWVATIQIIGTGTKSTSHGLASLTAAASAPSAEVWQSQGGDQASRGHPLAHIHTIPLSRHEHLHSDMKSLPNNSLRAILATPYGFGTGKSKISVKRKHFKKLQRLASLQLVFFLVRGCQMHKNTT